jgi:hypothetical protein
MYHEHVKHFFIIQIVFCALLTTSCVSPTKSEQVAKLAEHSSSSVTWTSINGLMGLDIVFPVHFSLDIETNSIPNKMTLRNNLDGAEWIEISAITEEVGSLCSKDNHYLKDSAFSPSTLATTIHDANRNETHIEPLDTTIASDGIAFTAYGVALLGCGNIRAAKTNVVLFPSEKILYVISYAADKPILDEIAGKIHLHQ